MGTMWGGKGRVLLPAFVVFMLAAAVVWVGGERLYGASGDLTLHYDLANSIAHHWVWPAWGKPLDSGMALYPPLAHYLAAVAGTPYHSALIGLNVVGLLCVFFSYLLLADALLSESLAGSAIGLAITAAVLAYGRSQHAVIGFEVFWNFFYAQMVGVCVFLAFAFWLCRSSAGWLPRLAATAAVTFVCGWLYTIASVQVALAYLCLEGFRGLRAAWTERRLTVATVAPAVAGLVVLPPLIVFHPMFGPMVQAAGNDGGVDLMSLNTRIPIFAAALLAVSLLLGLVGPSTERWKTGRLFIATTGLATAAPALLQFVLKISLHLGSDYAVKKYGFSVMTLLAFGLGAAAAGAYELRPRRPMPQAARIVVASVLAAVAALKLAPFAPVDLHKFDRYERTIRAALSDTQLPGKARGNVMSRNHYFPWYLNHAASVVDLGGRAQASFDAATHPDWEFTERDLAPFVFIENQDKTIPGKCILSNPDLPDIALISTSCFIASSGELAPGTSLDMAKLTRRPAYFTSGWSGKEAAGFWSDGKSATVVVHLNPVPDPILLSFDVGSFIASADAVQRVTVSTGGRTLGQWVFDAKKPDGVIAMTVPRELVTNNVAKIDFSFPDAVSPAERKISADTRQLAIYVRGMSLAGFQPLHVGETVNVADASSKPGSFSIGWSGKEGGWIWSDGDHAAITLRPEGSGPVTLAFRGAAFIAGKGQVQHVILSVRGHEVGRWQFDDKSPEGIRTVTAPRELVDNGQLKLDFAFPDATSPAAHKLSSDSRKLAYRVASFTLEAPQKARASP